MDTHHVSVKAYNKHQRYGNSLMVIKNTQWAAVLLAEASCSWERLWEIAKKKRLKLSTIGQKAILYICGEQKAISEYTYICGRKAAIVENPPKMRRGLWGNSADRLTKTGHWKFGKIPGKVCTGLVILCIMFHFALLHYCMN